MQEFEAQTLGDVIKRARKAKGWTQRRLATEVGYGESGVTIARIETGATARPDDEKLEKLAELLELDVDELRHLAAATTRPGLLASTKLRKRNVETRENLEREIEQFGRDVESRYQPLEQLRRDVEERFLQPFFVLSQRIDGIEAIRDAELVARPNPGWTRPEERGRDAIDYLDGILGTLTAALAAGAAVGAAAGAGAAFATYSAVGAFASASTGTAISTLAGAAATNATLAALGGGSLAAGGWGIAAGTAVLGAIAAGPLLLLGGAGLLVGDRRATRNQLELGAKISAAEDEFDASKQRLEATFGWAAKAQTFLTLADQAAAKRLSVLRAGRLATEAEPDQKLGWEELSQEEQEAFRYLFQLAARTISVLPLPAIPTPDPELPPQKVEEVARVSEAWNEDVLSEALSWFAL